MKKRPPTEPDGFIVIHHRMTDTLYFGPFLTIAELQEWFETVGDPNRVSHSIIPVFKTVDWTR